MSVVADFPPPAVIARNLPDVVTVFRKWMHMPDPDPLYAVLGAVVANRLPGDPIWLLLVCGSSWGKSEILGATTGLVDVFRAATLTEASLLSGTPKREKAENAKGGLLREIGPNGIIVCKDFGSVLSMSRDPRAAVLAALREIYDGAWTRHVGTDGGKSLHWQGKVGFLGACTPNIDRHHAVMASMGERFAFIRLADTDDIQVAKRALQHAGRERTMRDEMSDAVLTFLDGLNLQGNRPNMTDDERDRLIALTTLTVRCRAGRLLAGYRARTGSRIPRSPDPCRSEPLDRPPRHRPAPPGRMARRPACHPRFDAAAPAEGHEPARVQHRRHGHHGGGRGDRLPYRHGQENARGARRLRCRRPTVRRPWEGGHLGHQRLDPEQAGRHRKRSRNVRRCV